MLTVFLQFILKSGLITYIHIINCSTLKTLESKIIQFKYDKQNQFLNTNIRYTHNTTKI